MKSFAAVCRTIKNVLRSEGLQHKVGALLKGVYWPPRLQEGFSQASEVLVSGCSAGGLATFNWANHFRNLFPPTVLVSAAPDSGLFLDFDPIDGDQTLAYRNFYFKSFMQIVNFEVDPVNSKCVTANPINKCKCLMAPYLLEYIDVPLFFVQSHYDAWSIPNILKMNCVSD
jgi:pimeloyl-ACP methyl ester carboxylesterase